MAAPLLDVDRSPFLVMITMRLSGILRTRD